MNDIKSRLDKKTGKVILTGTVDEERDFKPIHDRLPDFRQQVKDLKEQVAAQEKQLEELGPAIYDSEIEKFLETQKKVAEVERRSKLEKDIEVKRKQLVESEKVLVENEKLDAEYEEYLTEMKQ